jgi:hypothetical protein
VKFFYQFKQSWNKSLSLRIISTTFMVSTVLVTIIGLILINRVSTGILSAKESSSLTEASSAINEAQKVVTATDTGAGERVNRVFMMFCFWRHQKFQNKDYLKEEQT